MTIQLNHTGAISKITMARPPMNLLDIETMDALVRAHQEADQRSETRVIITQSGVDGVFSNGLDPLYVLKMKAQDRIAIFDGVSRMLHHLFALSKPHICAINGPAMAGGAILAITADFRIFDENHGRISFSEPKVGLPIPEAVSNVIRQFCCAKSFRDVVLLGKNMDAAAALEAGLADAVVPSHQMKEALAKLADRMARLSPSVLSVTKAGLRRKALEMTRANLDGNPEFNPFVGDDYLGEGLTALVEKRFPVYRD